MAHTTPSVPAPSRSNTTGLVLAGGQGTRMGGVDKGLQPLAGQPLAWHALERLRPQVGTCLISANRHRDRYATWGVPVLADTLADYPGPLAGFLAGLLACPTEWLLTVPCDSPFFPTDLARRLAACAQEHQARLVLAAAPDAQGVLRPQPTFALIHRDLAPGLADFLARGEHKIGLWAARQGRVLCPFDRSGDAPLRSFANVNTLAQLQELQELQALPAAQESVMPQQDLSVPHAQALLADMVAPLTAQETLPLPQARGRILAQDIVSPIDVPAHDNSAMDGYAFAGVALQPGQALTLTIVGTALAGQPWGGTLQAGQALRIMTGAVIPAGADTVVPQELVTVQGSSVTLPADGIAPRANTRLRGEDLAQGQIALEKGQILHAAAWGLAASLGLAALPVVRRVRVACFSTGDEILSLGESPRPGAVYDSNRYTITSMLHRLGVEVIDLGAIPDEPERLRQAFAQAAATADAIITSGGVSTGAADHTQALMQELGKVAFWRLALRPGRPLAVGKIMAKNASSAMPESADSSQNNKETWLFGLPGNPVAAMVSFLALVRPALQRLMGAAVSAPLHIPARCGHAIRKRPGRTEYLRAIVEPAADGTLQVRTTGAQGSGLLHSMVQANALIVLAHEQGDIAAGEMVPVWLLDGML